MHQLGDVLYEHLPGLGIPSAYLVLYEKTGEPQGLFTPDDGLYRPGAGIEQSIRRVGVSLPASCCHRSSCPTSAAYSLVVEPLYFQDKSLGVCRV